MRTLFAFSFLIEILLALPSDQYLTHYWPICNNQMSDHIGSAHMTQESSTTFTLDWFGNENSALALNGSWTQVPAGIYFNTPEFTISVWVYPFDVTAYSRIIDFGNGENKDNIVISLSHISTFKPYAYLNNAEFVSSKMISFNEWQLLTLTFNGTYLKMY